MLLKQLSDMYIESDRKISANRAISVNQNTKNDSQIDMNANISDDSNLNVKNQHATELVKMSYSRALTTVVTKSTIDDEKNKNFDQQIDNGVNKNHTDNLHYRTENKYHTTEKSIDKLKKSEIEFKPVGNDKNEIVKYRQPVEVKNSEGCIMHILRRYLQNKKLKNKVEIEALSGAKVIVPIDNYHGLSESQGQMVCKVCRKIVFNKNIHKYEEEHLKNVQGPIQDENFYRQVSLFIVFKSFFFVMAELIFLSSML